VCAGSENVLIAEHKRELNTLVIPSPIGWIVCRLGAGAV
jgi:hypothetical protein